jgi:hypothetical protein
VVVVAVERARSNRLELWIGALIADMRKYEGLIQDEKDRYEALKAEKKKEDAEHKYQVRSRPWLTQHPACRVPYPALYPPHTAPPPLTRPCSQVWRKTVALQRLATDPGALFLFFIQRIANMAGSRRAYNDALRANGAMVVIVALCQVRG